jgi:uncharacterized protein YndB with AHSA1/START domain
MHGTYETVDGRPALRFERRLDHPVERVWRAVTDPAELRFWFPAAVEVDLRADGPMAFTFDDPAFPRTEGRVLALDEPRRFWFSWGGEELRFDLEPVGEGCRLVFTHLLEQRDAAARDAAGWHVCLAALEDRLAGRPAQAPGTEPTAEHRALHEEYERRGLPTGAPVPSGS